MEWNVLKHSIYIRSEEGRILGEITFPEHEPGVYTIERTHTAEEFIGTELPGQLVEAAVKQIKEQGGKVEVSCPYASRYVRDHHLI